MGVFASAVMLYGMSLLYGVTGSTCCPTSASARVGDSTPIVTSAIVFVLVGFAFKVSAVPFHTWAPDTYEGAPTPITAFLSVLVQGGRLRRAARADLIAFPAAPTCRAAHVGARRAHDDVGNLVALRQTNIVRMLAYSASPRPASCWPRWRWPADRRRASLGRHLPAHLRGHEPRRLRRGDGRGPQDPQRRDQLRPACSSTPRPAVLMTVFLFSLAGIPPLGGWLAKFVPSGRARRRHRLGLRWPWSWRVNSVIALATNANVARIMGAGPTPTAILLAGAHPGSRCAPRWPSHRRC
jgi:NADH-quinone oxidoreductase subunit N